MHILTFLTHGLWHYCRVIFALLLFCLLNYPLTKATIVMVPLREINTFTVAPILSTIAGSEPIFRTVHTPLKNMSAYLITFGAKP